MVRIPRELPDGSAWVDKMVRWTPKGGKPPEIGKVQRMCGGGKALSMMVQFGDGWPVICYAQDLEVIGE